LIKINPSHIPKVPTFYGKREVARKYKDFMRRHNQPIEEDIHGERGREAMRRKYKR